MLIGEAARASLLCAKGGGTEGDGGIVLGEPNIALSLAYKRMIMFLSILCPGCVYRSSYALQSLHH